MKNFDGFLTRCDAYYSRQQTLETFRTGERPYRVFSTCLALDSADDAVQFRFGVDVVQMIEIHAIYRPASLHVAA